MTGGPLSGRAIARYAGGLFEAFPDLSVEVINAAATGSNSVAAQWVMRGTNTNKVVSVKGYFDSIEVPRQLGMQVIVRPRQ